jgi:hypothetical protein
MGGAVVLEVRAWYLLFPRPGYPARANPARPGFPQVSEQVGMSTASPAGVASGVEICGRLQVLVSETVLYQHMCAWIVVEGHLGI